MKKMLCFCSLLSMLFSAILISKFQIDFNDINKFLEDKFKTISKENLYYLAETDDLVLNYTNFEETMIDEIVSLDRNIQYKFSYKFDYGFAYPIYVKRIDFSFTYKSGLQQSKKDFFVNVERNIK